MGNQPGILTTRRKIMKKLNYLAGTLGALSFALLIGPAHAEIQDLYFDVKTTVNGNLSQRVDFWIEVKDSHSSHLPDVIKSIKVTAPDSTEFVLDPISAYLPFDAGYSRSFAAADFSGNIIPAGTYNVQITDINDNVLTGADYIDGKFLNVPTITWPTEGATVGATPKFQWKNLPAAQLYRVLLYNETWDEPVYWYYNRKVQTQKNYFQIPSGILKANCNYSLRIEARTTTLDHDKRSRTDWLHFSTKSF